MPVGGRSSGLSGEFVQDQLIALGGRNNARETRETEPPTATESRLKENCCKWRV